MRKLKAQRVIAGSSRLLPFDMRRAHSAAAFAKATAPKGDGRLKVEGEEREPSSRYALRRAKKAAKNSTSCSSW